MGLFDYVDFPTESCPTCGRKLSEWQTKDPADEAEYLRWIDVSDIRIGGEFSAYCDPGRNRDEGCGTFVRYHLKPTGYVLERRVEAPDGP